MVTLEKLNESNIRKVMNLSVAKEQEAFVATNYQSIAEAYLSLANGEVALPFGIFDGERAVGFLMIGYQDVSEDLPSIGGFAYSVWRLMIDRNEQGKGYGREAMRLALTYVETRPAGDADWVYLSYEPENTVGAKLYRSMGFFETGEVDGNEIIAVKKLPGKEEAND